MTTRIRAAILIGTLLITGPALAACGTKSGGGTGAAGSPSASAPADPKADLLAAVNALNGKPMHVEAVSKSDVTLAVTTDIEPGTGMHTTFNGGTGGPHVAWTVLGQKLYVKVDFTGMGDLSQLPPTMKAINRRWVVLDASKVSAPQYKTAGPADVEKIASEIRDVKRVDSTHFTGTIDLSDTTAFGLDSSQAKALGNKAMAIPFTATIDDQHRLAQLVIQVPTAGAESAETTTITFTKVGEPVTLTAPPASSVVQPPADLYKVLNQQ